MSRGVCRFAGLERFCRLSFSAAIFFSLENEAHVDCFACKTFAVQDLCGEVAVEVLEGMCGV